VPPLEPPDTASCLVGPLTLELLIACARSTPPGCFVEVGVFRGGSAQHLHALALEQDREIYLYDTFEGMPYFDPALDSHPLGDFANTDLKRIRSLCPWANIGKGIFPDSSLPMPPIAFAHVDVDNYRCVYETAFFLKDRMAPGGVIWFDDSPCLAGAAKATQELFAHARILSKTGQHYVALGIHHAL
jgi:hypothetical protein